MLTRAAAVLSFAAVWISTDAPARVDDEWSDAEIALINSLRLANLGNPPGSASNSVADSSEAAVLGKLLFFDESFGAAKIACASCHQPENYYTDNRRLSTGALAKGRNTPTVVGTAFQSWFYWDGRRDSLWSQALVPFEAPDEMGSTRSAVVRRIASVEQYRTAYEGLFGRLPGHLTSEYLPEGATPVGDKKQVRVWNNLTPVVRRSVNRVFSNVGKVIAAYERTLFPSSAVFDVYADALVERKGPPSSMTKGAIRGLRLFINAGQTRCINCHNGPLFTNGFFHNVGTGRSNSDQPDFGRLAGLESAKLDKFNCMGEYSDAKPQDCHALRFLSGRGHGNASGAFKVPSLRNVLATAPYFHDGRFRELQEVVSYYDKGGNQPSELRPLNLSLRQRKDLVAFLRSLSPAN